MMMMNEAEKKRSLAAGALTIAERVWAGDSRVQCHSSIDPEVGVDVETVPPGPATIQSCVVPHAVQDAAVLWGRARDAEGRSWRVVITCRWTEPPRPGSGPVCPGTDFLIRSGLLPGGRGWWYTHFTTYQGGSDRLLVLDWRWVDPSLARLLSRALNRAAGIGGPYHTGRRDRHHEIMAGWTMAYHQAHPYSQAVCGAHGSA